MAIQFGGLATGLDTETIITKLMNIERLPLTRLEADKTWQSNRLQAFTELDSKFKAFADAIKDLNYSSSLKKYTVAQNSTSFLSATAGSASMAGTSYQVEVVSLAQVQKSVTTSGVADKTAQTFGTGEIKLTVGGTEHSIAIADGDNSLEGIMKAINKAGVGVSAAIINDGSGSPFRLTLTGAKVAEDFSLDISGLTGGTDTLDGVNNTVQAAQRAHIRVDGIDIYSNSNTLTEAIPGVTLDLLKAEAGSTTTLSIALDNSAIKSSIEAFAKGYNDVMSFIFSQSATIGKDGTKESDGGLLGGDSGMNAIKRHLQNMLTQTVPNSGPFAALSQLGFETQRDGTLKVNDEMLSKAVNENLDGIISLFAGENGEKGIITQYKDYLFELTSSSTGMLRTRKDSINDSIEQIDKRIERMEARLTQRQATLEAQFTAMEKLVSTFNAQSDYLTQQMDSLRSMNKK